jgi:hypothetical protein
MLDSTILRASAVAGVFVAALTLTGAAAGEPRRPPPAAPPPEVQTVVTVRVSLPTAGPPGVVVTRHHGSRTFPKLGDASWFGTCLADRAHLERWLKSEPHHPARRLWARALKKQGYEALVFLQGIGNDLRPACLSTADGTSMRHTDLHPDYREYVRHSLAGTEPPWRSTVPLHPPLPD